MLPPDTLVVDLADPQVRTRHLADPGAFLDLCRARPADKPGQFVFVDEAQAVPTIEVKWSEKPTPQDARHLRTFLAEHPEQAKHGYVVCRSAHPLRIRDQITALPWFCL